MLVNRIIKILLILLSVVFIVFQGLAYEMQGEFIGVILLVLLITLCYKKKDKNSKYFTWFLVTYAIGQLIGYFSMIVIPQLRANSVNELYVEFFYYIGNTLSILSYIFLILRISTELSLKKIYSELMIPIFILIALDVFCVVLVSETTRTALTMPQYIMEFTYNAVIMALMSVSVINYLYRNDNKSMLLLVGSICIVFSEIIQLAYYYVLDDDNLRFIYSLFLVLAFLLFYLQSQLQFVGPQKAYTDEHYEA